MCPDLNVFSQFFQAKSRTVYYIEHDLFFVYSNAAIEITLQNDLKIKVPHRQCEYATEHMAKSYNLSFYKTVNMFF
jgi:hypothetical protein